MALLTAVSLAVVDAVLSPLAPEAEAASGEQFDPGMIIADSLFYDNQAMSVAEIQSFLNSKIGTCQNSLCLNVLQVSYGGRARQVSTNTGRLICDAIAGGTMSAAELIYRAQVACGISAKVILVTLQKEQSLVTAKAPTERTLTRAMGMACPDTAPCDSAYSGFAIQVVEGARQLKAYYAASFARQPGAHYIGYNPNVTCGSTLVNIRNYATAALYNYTPYQPNAAALTNMYGTGDSCSSYGNRNFFRFYTDWFGSTQGANFITRTDTTEYLAGIDPSWQMWAYPIAGPSAWGPRVTLGIGWNGIERLIGIGDFNGNGQRDLVAIDSAKKAWLYPGDGELSYPRRTALTVDWSTSRFVVYGGNANGDTAPDVYSVDAAGNLWLWPGTGTGTFGAPVAVATGFGSMTLVVGPGDLTGDGCGDLLRRGANGELALLAGNCVSGFSQPISLGGGWGTVIDVYAIDYTKDGRVDLLARSSAGQLHLWRGDGGGRIAYVGIIDSGWQTMGAVAGAGPLVLPVGNPVDPSPGPSPTPDPEPGTGPVVTPPGSTGFGDFDRDGMRDFFGITLGGELRMYRGNGSGSVYSSTPVLSSTWGTLRTFPLGDFNSDGYQDLGRITSLGNLEVAYGTASGTLGAPVVVSGGWSGYNLVMGGFDWDGDGRADLIARDAAGNLWLFRSDGTGAWLPSQPKQIGSGWGPFTAIFPAGDFDGLGGVDLLTRSSDGVMRLYPSNGTGGFRAAKVIDAGWNGFTTLFSPGNFDALAGPDVLARGADGRLWLYSGTGSGTFVQQYKLVDSGWHTMMSIG